MELKSKIDEIVERLKSDPTLFASFTSNPEKTIESLFGVELPNGAADHLIAEVKSKLDSNSLFSGINKLF